MTFIEKLRAAQAANHSYVCVGLDPDVTKMPPMIGQSGHDILEFCNAIIDATADLVSAYKPNLAFFLAHGAVGIDVLRQVIAHVPPEIPTILDAKFGDIGNTAEQYADFAYQHLQVDAVTVSPYVGTEAVEPFIKPAEKLAFVLCRTSNIHGNEFQAWPNSESPLYRHVTEQMLRLSEEYPEQVGLVVGATQPDELKAVRMWAANLPFLVPGIGAQGGDLAAVVQNGITRDGIGPVINTGRTVLYASQGSDYAQAARAKVIALRDEINALRMDDHVQ
jgi:orotidine-5'-phosphate decarboxylase